MRDLDLNAIFISEYKAVEHFSSSAMEFPQPVKIVIRLLEFHSENDDGSGVCTQPRNGIPDAYGLDVRQIVRPHDEPWREINQQRNASSAALQQIARRSEQKNTFSFSSRLDGRYTHPPLKKVSHHCHIRNELV